MAGNKHSWHTGAPIHIQLKGFFGGISHIFIPFVHIVEYWIHLEDFVLGNLHFDKILHFFVHCATQLLFIKNLAVILKASVWLWIKTFQYIQIFCDLILCE